MMTSQVCVEVSGWFEMEVKAMHGTVVMMITVIGNGCHEKEPRLAKRVSLSDPLPYPNEVHEDGAWEGKASSVVWVPSSIVPNSM